MAIRHGKAGQFGKSEAKRRAMWFYFAIFIVFAIVFVGYGFCWGFFWNLFGYTGAAWISAAFMIAVWLIWKRLDRWLDRVALDRIKYLRGGQGEALVAWLLQDLPADWHVFNGLKVDQFGDISSERAAYIAFPPNPIAACSVGLRSGCCTTASKVTSQTTRNGKPCGLRTAWLRY